MSNQRWLWLSILIATILLVVLFVFVPAVSVSLHAIVNVFATGRTGVKTLVFLAYIGSVAALMYVRSGKNVSIDDKSLFWKKVSISSLIAAYGLNFGSYLWLMMSWHIPVFTYSIIYNNGTFTSLQFLHNHVTKGAIAIVTTLFPAGITGHFDAGTALLGLVPDIVFWIQAIFSLALITGIYMIWKHEAPRIGSLRAPRVFLYWSMLVLSSFMVLKSVFDGGFLSFEGVIGSSFLLILFFEKSLATRRLLLWGNLCYFLLIGVLYWSGYFATDASYGHNIFSTFTAFMMLSALYALYSLGRTRLNIFVLVMALIPFSVQVYSNLSVFEYRNTLIEKGDIAYLLSYGSVNLPGYIERDTIGNIKLYEFSPGFTVKVGDIIPHTGFADNMTPVSVVWKTCIPSAPPVRYTVDVLAPQEMKILSDSTKTYRIDAVQKTISEDGFYTYSVTITARPCLVPQPVSFVEEVLGRYFDRFVIYNIEQFENGE